MKLSMEQMQKRAAAVAAVRTTLADLLSALEAELQTVKDGHLQDIRRAARRVADGHNKLRDAIEANPDLFKRPRTQTVDGLRFGYRKKVGKMTWDDDAKVIERMRRLQALGEISAEQMELLINKVERPVVKALEQLDGRMLKRLGVEVQADSDQVVILGVDAQIEKQIDAMIKDATQQEAA